GAASSRALGVTMVRGPMKIFLPCARAARTSLSQTKSTITTGGAGGATVAGAAGAAGAESAAVAGNLRAQPQAGAEGRGALCWGDRSTAPATTSGWAGAAGAGEPP